MIWIAVAVGGALGSLTRHGLNHIVHQRFLASAFPLGIFVINLLGAAAIGIFGGLTSAGRLNPSLETRTFLVVGFLGGLTTFSSFVFDSFALLRDGHAIQAFWNVVGQVGLGLLAVSIGYKVAAIR